MIEVPLSRRVRIACGIVAQNRPVVLPSPFGEAIAASSDRIIDIMFQNRRLGLQRERVGLERERTESLIGRREDLQAAQRADLAAKLFGQRGVPLGEQPRIVADSLSQVVGEDVRANPELANVPVLPFTPEDRIAKLKLDLLKGLEESDDPDDQAAAEAFREQLALGGQTIEELLSDESTAKRQVRINREVEAIADRVSQGPDAFESPEEFQEASRFYRNVIAQQMGTPFRIEVLGPGGQTLVADDQIASTLTSQWWQSAREGRATSDEAINSLSSNLSTMLDGMGVAVPETVTRNIVTAINEGDQEGLREIAALGDEAQIAVETALRGRARVEGFRQLWLNSLHPAVRPVVENGLGELSAIRASGAPREEILNIAKDLDKRIQGVIRRTEDLEPEDVPSVGEPSAWADIGTFGAIGMGIGFVAGGGFASPVTAGATAIAGGLTGGIIGGAFSGGTEFAGGGQPGTAEPTLEDLLSNLRGSEQGGGGGARLDAIAEAFNAVTEGGMSLVEARDEFGLDNNEIRRLGGMLADEARKTIRIE